jgi:hypothetical protein
MGNEADREKKEFIAREDLEKFGSKQCLCEREKAVEMLLAVVRRVFWKEARQFGNLGLHVLVQAAQLGSISEGV